MLPDPIEALDSGATVITANRRLAHSVRNGYAERQRQRGLAAWPTPSIATLDDWLAERWREWMETAPDAAGRPRRLLTSAQERVVWEEIVAGEDGAKRLLDVDATAAAAGEAWRLLHDWELETVGSPWNQSEDTEAFQRWAQRFARRCRQNGWVSAAQLPAELAAAMRRGELAGGPAQLWLGFDPHNPARVALCQALQAAGTTITDADAEAPAARPHIYGAADTESEIRSAARWARRHIATGTGGQIGVVIADLDQSRGLVERIFSEELHSDREPWDGRARAFHISLGVPLTEHPVVAAAARVLESAQPRAYLAWPALAAWLRSPFVAGAEEEAVRRGSMEAELRRRGHTRLPLAEFATQAARMQCPQLAAALRRMQAIAPDRGHRTHADWAERMATLLEAAGWPGERTPNSAEFQAMQAWRRLLDEFAAIDQVSGVLDYADALARMQTLAAARIFQPRMPAARVEIMGWLEARGQEFGALWVLGLDETRLPARARPQPFLPWNWQRDANLPHASHRYEEQFARLTLERLCASASTVVLSWPRHADDGRELRASPLLRGNPLPEPDDGGAMETRRAATESIADSGPEAGMPERHATARTFEDQAACAFRSFAHHRLAAHGLDPVHATLSPRTRGSLLHRTLCHFWSEFRATPGQRPSSLARLNALSETELEERLADAAARAVAEERLLLSRPALAGVERERLSASLRAWIDEEKKRADFNVLELEFEPGEIDFAGLTLRLRLDRIDELADGGRALLDYKSGEAAADWDGERPQAPQLPLYAAVDPDPGQVAAVALAQLKPGAMGFRGAARQSGALPGLGRRGTMLDDGRIADWHGALTRLAQRYLAGDAGVLPYRRPSTCQYCTLPALCRIHEIALDGRDDDEDEMPDE